VQNIIFIKEIFFFHRIINNRPKNILYIKKGVIPIRSTNLRKYLIVKKATNAEVINPTISCALKIYKLAAIESPTKNINAPKMVGIDKRNANLEESFKFNPKNKQAIITTPDLEAPGINAKT
tara:strand:+ start:2677 stop:3042 length:366 start_codon:yes stop_codon:yes gene_type:complete